MMSIHSLLPDADAVLSLEPEELAGYLIEYLHDFVASNQGKLSRYNFGLRHTFVGYPNEKLEAVSRAWMEAWIWLEREGLLAPEPGETGEWRYLTRRGLSLHARKDVEAYRHSQILPRKLLHPVLAQRVWPAFLRGEYDTAVFQAFKQVEVSVRQAAGGGAIDIGVPLMRKAFDPTNGPLTDTSQPVAEREALCHLFAGAIGIYKNPSSHRQMEIGAEECVELVVLASHLMRVVEFRHPQRDG
jgi:uncharacterized protein (TIGR02391 family)